MPRSESPVELRYEIPRDVALLTFPVKGKQKHLLEEIYDRLDKLCLEQEYCLRYLRPDINIDRVSVRIRIPVGPDEDPLSDPQELAFRLDEDGYPDRSRFNVRGKVEDPVFRSGDALSDHLTSPDA